MKARASIALTLLLATGVLAWLFVRTTQVPLAVVAQPEPPTAETLRAPLKLQMTRVLTGTAGLVERPAHVPGQVLVRFAAEVGPEQRREILSAIGATTERAYTSLPGVQLVRLPAAVSVSHALARLDAYREVTAAEPDFIYYAMRHPNDPSFGSLWGLHNTGQNNGAADVDLDAPRAWDETTGSDDVVIGVIDSGIDYTHVDLIDNIWSNPGEIPDNGVDDDGNGYVDDVHGIDTYNQDGDPLDDEGHGTHVAGTIAAQGNNGVGVVGVMWDAQLIACKFLGASGSGLTSGAIECLDYFVALKQAGVNIVVTNNSWGGGGYSQLLYDAIARQSHNGILFVASAGNTGTDIDGSPLYPAGYGLDAIVSVAAIDRYGRLANFSSYGDHSVDIAAPGVDILSAGLNDTYVYSSGTSMAAPHITGLVGLLQANSPGFTAAEAKEWIMTTGVSTPELATRTVSGMRARIELPFIDTDGDGMSNRWEEANGFNPADPGDASLDTDNDGLTNLEEFLNDTDPRSADTDGDGLDDRAEVQVYMTSPLIADTDGDGLDDGDEVTQYATDPNSPDTDGDGLGDGEEIAMGTDPNSADSDGDGMDDGWEVQFGFNPLSGADATGDRDGDGLSNAQEFANGTDPNDPDTDGDGLSDGAEITVYSTDPTSADSDTDGMDDGWEVQFGFDPLDPVDADLDSDGDGYSNRSEYRSGSDPTDPVSIPPRLPWTAMQGDSRHTGYVPFEVDPADIAERWRDDFFVRYQTDVAVINNVLFLASDDNDDPRLQAMSLPTGDLLWRHDFVDTSVASAPVVHGPNVYVFTREFGVGATLHAFDMTDGAPVFSRAHASGEDMALVPHDGRLYARNGETLVSYDALTGDVVWETPVTGSVSYRDWIPAVNDTHVAVFANNTLSVFDRVDGSLIFENADVGCSTTANAHTILDVDGNAVVRYDHCLARFDLTTGELLWDIDGIYGAIPAVDETTVYHYDGQDIVARALADGMELWRWNGGVGGFHDNFVVTLNHLFASDAIRTHAIDLDTRQIDWTGHRDGRLAITDDGALIIAGPFEVTVVDIVGDTDGDLLPDWWERLHYFDRLDPSDAALDTDADGLSNLAEFEAGTDPRDADSDDDGLTDGAEIDQHGSDPLVADTDDDGLTDGQEVTVHGTDPLLADTDGDGFSDGNEIQLYFTDPTDPDSIPALTTDFRASFEDEFPAAWDNGAGADAGWSITQTDARDGTYSLRSDEIGDSERAVVEWSGTFADGDLRFDARVSADDCCDKLHFYIDGERIVSISNGDWQTVVLPVRQGEHTLRWEYAKNHTVARYDDAAWIDNIRFLIPLPFAYRDGNVLAVTNRSLQEYTPAGEQVRSSLPIPQPRFPAELVVTDAHTIFIGDGGQWHVFDPIDNAFSTFEDSRAGSIGNLAATSQYVVATRSINGLARFSLDGQFVDTVLEERRYVDLTVGGDGLVYGLRNRNGDIDVIDPVTWAVTREVDLGVGRWHCIAVNAAGEIYAGNWQGSVDRFDADGALLQSVATLSWLIDLDFIADGMLAYSNSIGLVGVVAADLSRVDAIPLVNPEWGSHVARINRTGTDTDGDGIPDWWERFQGLDPHDALDAGADPDADQLDNLGEFVAGSEPFVADTDGDGLTDGAEVNQHGSDPVSVDTDSDGVSDFAEITVHFTDPTLADTDGDGLTDGAEIDTHGSDPLDADSDDDGMPDGWEVDNGLALTDPADASADPDMDGLTNLEEYANGTRIDLPDTDNDGLDDGDEVDVYGTDPLSRDTDNDRLADGWELQFGLDAFSAADATSDPDDDGYSNVQEYYAFTDPRVAGSRPALQPWSTHQGTARHRGHVRVQLDPADFHTLWSVDVIDNDTRPLSQVAAGNGQVFVTTAGFHRAQFLSAYDALSGARSWQHAFGTIYNLSPPALDRRQVYAQTSGSSDTYFWSFDRDTGAVAVQSAFAAQWPTYRALTLYDGTAYGYSGYYGGLAGFDAITGRELWHFELDNASFSAAVDQSHIYVVLGGGGSLRVVDRLTGIERFSIEDPDYQEHRHTSPSPVLTRDDVIAVHDGRLLRYDLAGRRIASEVSAFVSGQPAFADGVIYAQSNDELAAYDDRNGAELWRWVPPEPISGNIVATTGHVIVPTASEVHAVDVATATSVWSAPYSGQLALGNDGILYIAGRDGVLSAIATYLDADLDGLPDDWEEANGLDPGDAGDVASDSDGDGLDALHEYYHGTSPGDADTDADGLNDGDEVDVFDADPLHPDTDGDTLTDGDEVHLHGSDPIRVDTDSDRLDDAGEVTIYGTNPAAADTDGDGLNDGYEVGRDSDPTDAMSQPLPIRELFASFESGAVPLFWSNGEAANTGWEVVAADATDGSMLMRTLPINRNETAAIVWADTFEQTELSFDVRVQSYYCCNTLEFYVDGVSQASVDQGDWRTVEVSLTAGWHTLRWEYRDDNTQTRTGDGAFVDAVRLVSFDVDEDTLPDRWERFYGLDPDDPADAAEDPDDDTLSNLREFELGTVPIDADTEDDGMPDGWEVEHSLDPLRNDAAGDPDGDGVSNLDEFLAGTDPQVAPPPPPPSAPPAPPSSGSGGGGSADPLLLALCLVVGVLSLRRRRVSPSGDPERGQ